MVRLNTAMLWREAESKGDIEFLQGGHLPVEPGFRVRSETIRPAQAGPQVTNAQHPQPFHCLIKSVILKVEPLADSHIRSVVTKLFRGRFRCPVFPQQPHVEMPVVR
jgi:hypothetical protein